MLTYLWCMLDFLKTMFISQTLGETALGMEAHDDKGWYFSSKRFYRAIFRWVNITLVQMSCILIRKLQVFLKYAGVMGLENCRHIQCMIWLESLCWRVSFGFLFLKSQHHSWQKRQRNQEALQCNNNDHHLKIPEGNIMSVIIVPSCKVETCLGTHSDAAERQTRAMTLPFFVRTLPVCVCSIRRNSLGFL